MQHKKQELYEKIMRYIRLYEERNSSCPSLREIAAGIGIANSTVCSYLSDLEEWGYIVYDSHRRVMSSERKNHIEDMNVSGYGYGAPIAGTIACGVPKDAVQTSEETVSLPKSIFGSDPLFLLFADGESMIEAGIDDGDLVVVRQQRHASRGDIIVAYMDGETTLKGYYPEPEKNRIRLQPANETMRPIYVSSLEIQGVAVYVIKQIGKMPQKL
ncbi:MAG: repressor LexA [Clostridia bacterium]|nr:repressor LexA [Clostridia bacterium]